MNINKKHAHSGHLINRMARNSVFLILSRITDMSAFFITTPIIARYLGMNAFGEYALVMAITIFVKPLAEFGSESIICRDVVKNTTGASEYVNAAFIARALMSGFIMIIIYLFVGLVVSDNVFKHAILISAVTDISLSFCAIFLAVIRAYERMEYELLCNFFYQLANIAGITAVILLDLGFISLFYARLFSALIFLVFLLLFVFKYLLSFRKGFDWHVIKFIYKEAAPLAIFTLLITASSKIDVFFLNYFKGPADIALFEAPNRLITQLQFIPFSINASMFPFFARVSEDPNESLHIYYGRAVKFLYIFSIFPAMLSFLGSEAIINLLFGGKFLLSSVALRILSWSFIIFTLNHFLHNILIVLGKQRVIIIIVGISFLFNILLDLLLIPYYGYIGASIATLVSSFISFIITVFCTSRYAGRLSAVNILVKPSISALLAGIACYFIITKSFVSLLAGAFLGLTIYILMLLVLKAFEKNELDLIKQAIFRKGKTV